MTIMMNTIEEDYHLLLPDEITTEVLFRLPAESVMQCKLVCKTWQALIIDPNFIYMYTRHYSLNTTTAAAAAAELEWVSFPEVSQLQFVKYGDRGCHDHDENPIKQSKPIIYHPSSRKILEIKKIISCNGLISTTTLANKMFVCNPFTREYVDLPPITFKNRRSLMFMRMATGFGCHSSTNEYKVIIIYYFSSYTKGQVTIYTLGNGGWRDKGEISHRVIDGVTGGVVFNGALHWLTEQKDEIVSFDLADEVFRIVPSPPSQSPPYHRPSYLGLLGGCLYVTRRGIEDPPAKSPSTDIWVMDSKEYSWSKKFNISWKSGLSYHRPLALLESGRILLHKRGKPFVSYDPETESSGFVGKSEFPLLYTYRKTIVSLKALGETDATILDPDDSGTLEETDATILDPDDSGTLEETDATILDPDDDSDLIKKRKRNSDIPNCFS